MYIDLIVLIVLLVLVVFFFKKFSSFVYAVAIIDIVLRIFTAIKNNIGLSDLKAVIDKYIPESIPDIVGNYISDIPYTIFMWLFIVIYIIFLSYIIKIFWKKKKI